VNPNIDLDARFDPVVAWHNPNPEFMAGLVEGAVNVMSEPWFSRDHYRSDSNQHWRAGCPHAELAAAEFEWLQLLTHPEIWVYPGETIRTEMWRDGNVVSFRSTVAARGVTVLNNGRAEIR